MTALLTASLAFLAISSGLGVFVIIPWCNASMFRYRLWELRDDLHYVTRHREFANDEQACMLLRRIETTIELAPQLTVYNMGLWTLFARRHKVQPPGDAAVVDWTAVKPEDAPLLRSFTDRYYKAVIRHLLGGSPSGWAVAMVTAPAALVYVVRHRRDLISGEKPDDPSDPPTLSPTPAAGALAAATKDRVGDESIVWALFKRVMLFLRVRGDIAPEAAACA